MVSILAQAEFPGFSMQVHNHEFHLTSKLTDEIREYVSDFKDKPWDSYNLFDEDADCIKKLAEIIHNEVSQFNHYGEKRYDLYINGWVNVLWKWDSIKPHWHSAEKNSYYSCNISLDNYKSKTLFYPPWGDRNGHVIEMENNKGQGWFFPAWLWHEVPTIEDEERFTIGLDIHTADAYHQRDCTAPINRSRVLHEIYT